MRLAAYALIWYKFLQTQMPYGKLNQRIEYVKGKINQSL